MPIAPAKAAALCQLASHALHCGMEGSDHGQPWLLSP